MNCRDVSPANIGGCHVENKDRFISIPIKFKVSGFLKEEVVIEQFADVVYYRLLKRLKNYKKGVLCLRISGSKQYHIDMEKEVYYYSIMWGVKKTDKKEKERKLWKIRI